MDVHRLQDGLGRAGETKELVHQRIDPVDLMPDQVRESVAEIGILVTLRKELRESLDRDERVLDFVGHAGGVRGSRSLRRICNSSRFSAVMSVNTTSAPSISPCWPWKIELLARTTAL